MIKLNRKYSYWTQEQLNQLVELFQTNIKWYNKLPKIESAEAKEELVFLMQELLEQNAMAIANNGPNTDQDRKEIDTIIIHHTSGTEEIISLPVEQYLDYVNALQLLRLYASVHANPNYPDEYNKPIWSNHFYEGKQTFIAYHWLIWRSGESRQVLQDHQIGWQAGNWTSNCRSIAIAFVDNLEEAGPTEEALTTASKIIKQYKEKYPITQILAHKEVNTKTSCPGGKFDGENGWKNQLIA